VRARYRARMRPPRNLPPRIRTDASNAFAHHTMAVRVPGILNDIVTRNPDYPESVRTRLAVLASALAADQPIPPPDASLPSAGDWQRALGQRDGETWLSTDWFFAENYVYRLVAEQTRYFVTQRDPFAPIKREQYASEAHQEALAAALAVSGPTPDLLFALLGTSLFGNRIDLSLAAARSRGTRAGLDDLLIDERKAAVELLLERTGPVHIIVDNAGTELSLDLVLASRLIERVSADVKLHVKLHPTFVSDAIAADVSWFLGADDAESRTRWRASGAEGEALRAGLTQSLESGRLTVAAHPFYNGPFSLWELPDALGETCRGARLVILKGDANYRRALGDAIWSPETPFSQVTDYFPAPLLALRTNKSDPIVGLEPGLANRLDTIDPAWRVNGQRGVASLGGARPDPSSPNSGATP
jgi:hypothetical protein